MILSAARLAKKYSRELVLVWGEKVIPFHEATHFVGLLSEYFETGIREIDFPLQGEEVYIPKATISSRYVISESDFLYRNLYIAGWTHFILVENDFSLSPLGLTSELRDALLEILNPTPYMQDYINLNYIGLTDFAESLGVHCRSGGHISLTDTMHSIPSPSFIYEAACRVMEEKNLSTVLLCGQDKTQLSLLSDLFSSRGLSVVHHRLDDFPTASADGSNTRRHVQQAVADLILLSRSTHVLSSANSTFGAVASLASGRCRFILQGSDAKMYCLPSEVFSGSGL